MRLGKIVCVLIQVITNLYSSHVFGDYFGENLYPDLYWCVVEKSGQTLYKLCYLDVICQPSRRTNNFKSCTVTTSNLPTRRVTRHCRSSLWSFLDSDHPYVKYLRQRKIRGAFSRQKQKCIMEKSRQYRRVH